MAPETQDYTINYEINVKNGNGSKIFLISPEKWWLRLPLDFYLVLIPHHLFIISPNQINCTRYITELFPCLLFLLHLFSQLCGERHMLRCGFGSQRTTCGIQFFVSSVWVPEIKPKWSDLEARTLTSRAILQAI